MHYERNKCKPTRNVMSTRVNRVFGVNLYELYELRYSENSGTVKAPPHFPPIAPSVVLVIAQDIRNRRRLPVKHKKGPKKIEPLTKTGESHECTNKF